MHNVSSAGQNVRCFSLFVGQFYEWFGQMSVTDGYLKVWIGVGLIFRRKMSSQQFRA